MKLPIMPGRSFTVEVTEPIDVALKRLQARTAPSHRSVSRDRPLYGSVGEDDFKLCVQTFTRRGKPLRNSSRPVLIGALTSSGAGARVDVTMRAPYPVQIFGLLWVMIFAVALVVGVSGILPPPAAAGPPLPLAILELIGMGSVAPAFVWFGFLFEARSNEERLRAILTGEDNAA